MTFGRMSWKLSTIFRRSFTEGLTKDELEKSLFQLILSNKNPGDPNISHFEQEFTYKIRQYDFERSLPQNQRHGLFGIKIGMTKMYMKNKKNIQPITILKISDNLALAKRIVPGFNKRPDRMQVLACGVVANHEEIRFINFNTLNLYDSLTVQPRRGIKWFNIDPNTMPKERETMNALYFRVDQKVTIAARTQDKGFLGVMQKHGFKGQPATRGHSLMHRRPGSLSGFKGVVYPGYKMAGHVGLQTYALKASKIVRIDKNENLIYVLGNTPGPNNAVCLIRDSSPKDVPELPQDIPNEWVSNEILEY